MQAQREAHLEERNVVHNVPITEALGVAQVAEVVAVAPHLVCQLRVADGRAVHVVVYGVIALCQPLGQISDVMQHLQVHRKQHGSHCVINPAMPNERCTQSPASGDAVNQCMCDCITFSMQCLRSGDLQA